MLTKGKGIIAILLICGLVLTACSNNSSNQNQKSNKADQTQQTESFDFVKQLGIGWNLGNSLDSNDYKKTSSQEINKGINNYQIMGIYSTKEWSGWDASSTPYFDAQGEVNLVWKIESLKSDLSKQCGKFSLQIINNMIGDVGTEKVGVQVTDASFIKQDGTKIELEGLKKSYSLALKKGVSENADLDISHINGLGTSKDLIGGTLTVKAKITNYPKKMESGEENSSVAYYETSWGNPITTKAMIDKVAEEGFQTVRVPVTYYDHMADDFTIDTAWLDRVEEVVKYVLDDRMYCIINIHHDVGERSWLKADLSTVNTQKVQLAKVWKQISERFSEYDEHLIFEGFNEILNSDKQWTNAGADSYKAVNILNQAFVDAVRATGGKNGSRYLMLNTYAAGGSEDILDAFTIPKDTVNNRLLGSIHYYGELDKMETVFNRLNKTFVSNGVPVVIGEFASYTDMDVQKSLSYVKEFLTTAKQNGYAVIWWDKGLNNDSEKANTRTLLDRSKLEWYDQVLVDAIIKCYKEN
ncbi:MAG: glycoside hydrolase family 5 protein [bacterium]|nr:glycoside hydrolase family 5 protein [bacterium]